MVGSLKFLDNLLQTLFIIDFIKFLNK